jgi:hypothetical protein
MSARRWSRQLGVIWFRIRGNYSVGWYAPDELNLLFVRASHGGRNEVLTAVPGDPGFIGIVGRLWQASVDGFVERVGRFGLS